MTQAILSYLVLSLMFGVAITVARRSSGKERLAAAKTAGFAMLCSVLSMLVLLLIVILF